MACTPFVENTTTCLTRDEPEPESLPCQSCDSLKQEPAVEMCDIKECRASERGWRRSCGDRGIHRAGKNAIRVGESSRGNWYVRVAGYADKVSPVKMREFRRNYLHHGSSKTLRAFSHRSAVSSSSDLLSLLSRLLPPYGSRGGTLDQNYATVTVPLRGCTIVPASTSPPMNALVHTPRHPFFPRS